jgi:hypothetical protein
MSVSPGSELVAEGPASKSPEPKNQKTDLEDAVDARCFDADMSG